MKKKILMFFVIFFINILMVQAEEYNCQYYLKEGIQSGWWVFQDKTTQFRYTVDTEKKTIRPAEIPNDEEAEEYGKNGRLNALGDTAVNYEFDEAYYVDKLDGKCQSSIYVCKFMYFDDTEYVLLFNDTLQNDLINMKPYIVYKSWDFYKMYKDKESCEKAENSGCDHEYHIVSENAEPAGCVKFPYYDGSGDHDYSNKRGPIDITYSCDSVSNDKKDGLLDIVISKTTEYNDCKSGKIKDCVSSKIAQEYNEKLEELKSYCKSVIKYQNYTDSCMTSCLHLQDTLAKKNDETGLAQGLINDLNNDRECYLTESIVSMIYNVLKWAKYIAPILVIILSILDFIKAIAAQNDDDMKKAQGKFVKRLIVAALLFLLPLIINFMLKTFGLYNSDCDISNLFS